MAFVVEQQADALKAVDGRVLGVQARLSRHVDGTNAIALDEFVQGLAFAAAAASDPTAAIDPLGDMWLQIAAEVIEKLGFPLEAELFSSMLVVAQLARFDEEQAAAMARELLGVYRDTGVDGLYHFFASLRFACDIDCTAMAIRSRLALGDLRLGDRESIVTLARSTRRILGSAAVASVDTESNRSHGKDNGPLHRLVFKVYVDDHTVQERELDRGLKHDAVVVANGLWPVLTELAAGLRLAQEPIALREFAADCDEPRIGVAPVADIVAANLVYVTDHLQSGAWRNGTRYYRSPDAFLCSYSELDQGLVAELGGIDPLREAIELRRRDADPVDAIDIAMRGIAAANVGLDPTPELMLLVDTQRPGGDWPGFGALYSFGSTKAPRIYFGSPVVTAAFAARALSPAPAPLIAAQPDWTAPIVARVPALRGAAR